jgi:hypothetical protein
MTPSVAVTDDQRTVRKIVPGEEPLLFTTIISSELAFVGEDNRPGKEKAGSG